MLRAALPVNITLMVLLTITGCSQPGGLHFSRIFEPIIGQSESNRIVEINADTERLLAQNKATEALIVLGRGIDSGIPEEKLANSYIRAMNSLIAIADRMYMEQNFSKAGNSYRLTLKSYPTHTALKNKITRNQNDIHQQINNCADQLLDEGLSAYRNGELQAAIDTWSQIREFHPSYKASQQAIQTTRTQLKNLQSIKEGPG